MSETTREPSVIVYDVRGEGPMPEGSYVTEAAYLAIVAERDAAVREMAKARSIASKYAGDADLLFLILEEQKENGRGGLLPKVHARARKAERENEALRARLAACEKIVEAAKGVFNDFDESELGNEPTSVRILWNTYRAAVAAETQANTEDTP